MPPPFFGVPFRSGGDVVENQEYNRPTEFLKGFSAFGHAYKRVGVAGENAPETTCFSRRLMRMRQWQNSQLPDDPSCR